MVRQLEMPAKLLQNGDVMLWSQRFRGELRGTVTGVRVSGNLVFIDTPFLDSEDVAFQLNETVRVNRKDD